MKEDRVYHWMKNGALPTESVSQVFKSAGVLDRWERFKKGESVETLVKEAEQAEVVRGALIALSVIPFLLNVPADKKRLGALTGFLLFAIGGLVPLTMQVGVLPLFLLLASTWEIFAMNFTTGWILARLLGRPAPGAATLWWQTVLQVARSASSR